MAENKLVVDKIVTLRLLHDMRANMQKYAAGQSTPQICQRLVEGYAVFCEDENLSAKIHQLISSHVADVAFNPYAFKTTSCEEDKKQEKNKQKSATQNKAVSMLKKQIAEELKYQQSRGKMLDVPNDVVFEKISADEHYFTVNVSGYAEPLQFPVKQNKGKHFSSLGVKALVDKTYAKKGFDEKTFQFLSVLGDKGFTLEEMIVENVGKKYAPSQYKSYLGLSAKDELSDEQKKELEILNSLSATEQAKFIVGVKKRKLEQGRNQAFFEALNKEKNPLKLLADREKLGALFEQYEMKDCALEIQNEFIDKQIKTDKKNLWNCFNQNKAENSRFAYYDILMNNLIAENRDIFKNIFDFTSQQEMKTNMMTAYQKVKKLSVPMLPDSLCAEILARGIFQNAVNKNTHAEKLQHMNLLLNELGLNIKFETAKVTQAPDISIANGQQQAKIDRDAFEADKRTPVSQVQEKQFRKHLKMLGISHPDEESKHHFWALKYNAFIAENLNQSSNYVQTAREHPWNLDGHKLVHVFDTAGEFLVSDEKQKFSFMDFNALRRAYNSGKNLTLQIPILQVKTTHGNFENLLSPAAKSGCGIYISTDKSPLNFMQIPEYCSNLFMNKNKLAEKNSARFIA